MSSDQMLGIVYCVMLLVLVSSALARRRLARENMALLALIWVGIFILAFLIARLFI